MWKKLITNTVSEIKEPERRLNVIMPIIGLAVVAAVVVFLFKDHKDQDNIRDKYLKDRIIFLERQKDSTDAVTIEKLRLIIDQQNTQKQYLRK